MRRFATMALATLLAGSATVQAAEPDPMEKAPDRISPHRLTLPDAERAKMVLRQQQALRQGAAVSAEMRVDAYKEAHAMAWDMITGLYGDTGATLGAFGALYEVDKLGDLGTALGDAGVLLSLASWNIALSANPEDKVANLALMKDCLFWAAGRFGWHALQVNMAVVGLVDYALNQLGKASLAARRMPLASAFYNYHHRPGAPGFVGPREWARKFLAAEVRTKAEAYAVVREHFGRFWKQGPATVQKYMDLREVDRSAGALDRTLIVLGGTWRATSYNKDDERAVEEAYIREHVLPAMRRYFQVDLPARIRRQAQAAAADRLRKLVASANRTHTIRITIADSQSLGGKQAVRLGPWTATPSDGKVAMTFTRYAWAKASAAGSAQPVALFGWQSDDGRGFLLRCPIKNPLTCDSQDLVITPDAHAQIRVRVTNASTGKPLAGAQVGIKGPGGAALARTDGDGSANLGLWPAGDYQVGARAAEHEDRIVARTLTAGRAMDVALALPPAGQPEPPPPPPDRPGDDDPGVAEVDVDVPANPDGSKSQQRAYWNRWRNDKIAELRRRCAADPDREANKRACLALAGKPREMTCPKCGYKGKHWWMEDRWSCPGCEYCTMPQDVKRAGGLTYRQYASQIIARYDRAIARVNAVANAKIKELND